MPYVLQGKCVYKKNADGSAGETVKCHESEEKAKAHMRALYANVKDSGIAEFSLTVTKASYEKSEPDPNKKRRIMMVNSDTQPDLYDERMSLELFRDFTVRIEKGETIPEPFKSVACEDVWCGGMPYISIAHYGAGRDGKNIPGMPESVYVDGDKLKSKAFLYDTPLGRKLFDSLCDDLEKYKSGVSDHQPTRVSIGFLDLEHVHEVEGKSFVFTRTELGQKCDLCEKGVGGKIYKKGYLVHLAATRVPVNQRTEMALEEKSMDDIITKKDDAASIVGEDLANELEQKSLVDDALVVKNEAEGYEPTPYKVPIAGCYDPNTDSFDQSCIDGVMDKWMTSLRGEYENTVKSLIEDVVAKSLEKLQGTPVVEESMETKEVIVKADEPEKETPKEEVEEKKSALDTQFEALKSALAGGKSTAEIQEVFNGLGKEVEKSIPVAPASATDIAEIVKSAVEAAVAPLQVEIATLKASQVKAPVRGDETPVSRALNLRFDQLVQNSQVQKSDEGLSQIQKLARKSVYGQ